MSYKIRSFTEEEKNEARNVSTLEMLRARFGFSFKRKGSNYYCVEHDSLIINQDQRGWHWNSRGISGGDAISFLQKIERLTYPEAVNSILGERRSYAPSPPPTEKKIEKKQPFVLPEKFDGPYRRLFAYLCQTRKLDRTIVSELVKTEQIYEDGRHNAVFVGYDDDGKAASAVKRGTSQNTKFRGEVSGSNKYYTFNILRCCQSRRVYVFESPIECISHATMTNISMGNDGAYTGQNRISLNGLSDLALTKYLENNPDVKEIHICLNNDFGAVKKDGTPDENHGQAAAQQIAEKFSGKGYICVNHLPPYNQNDWNDALKVMVEQTKTQTRSISGDRKLRR